MVTPVPPSSGISPLPPGAQTGIGSARGSDIPFADLLKGLAQDASQQQAKIGESVEQLISGETDSIHDVVMTASRADLAFQFVMEIRNRLISSYEEIMRMQV